jgi:site-specific recombinase XerD
MANGLIESLPFGYIDKSAYYRDDMLAHVRGGPQDFRQADAMLTEWDEEPAFLTLGQIQAIRALHLSPTRSLLFELMVRVGLRSCEARTFPLKYVFNPAEKVGLKRGQMIQVKLNPRDMEIKYRKARIVDIPYSLMEEMHAYTTYERRRLCSASCAEPASLILTVSGKSFTKDSVVETFATLSSKVGFRFSPLMLRHSYAIHTLMKLRRQPDFKGEPLLYVRDQLGHSSVQTTVVYLNQINRLSGSIVLAMQEEFDRLFEAEPSPEVQV